MLESVMFTRRTAIVAIIGFAWLYYRFLGEGYALASIGKERFAVSYAEDRFAGQMWYFGWIALISSATALIAALFSPTRTRSEA